MIKNCLRIFLCDKKRRRRKNTQLTTEWEWLLFVLIVQIFLANGVVHSQTKDNGELVNRSSTNTQNEFVSLVRAMVRYWLLLICVFRIASHRITLSCICHLWKWLFFSKLIQNEIQNQVTPSEMNFKPIDVYVRSKCVYPVFERHANNIWNGREER